MFLPSLPHKVKCYPTKRQAHGNKEIRLFVQSEIRSETGLHSRAALGSAKNHQEVETKPLWAALFPLPSNRQSAVSGGIQIQ